MERWIVKLSSGKDQIFDEWEALRKFLFDQDVDMADYPVSVTLLVTDGEAILMPSQTVDIVTFQAIYTHGLVDGRFERKT